MKQNKQTADKSKRSLVEHATTRTSLPAHLEKFAKTVAEGFSHVEAAELCGRARGSASYLYKQPGVQDRIAEIEAITKKATDEAVTERVIRVIRKITIDRNDIIMGLVDCTNAPRTIPAAILGVRVKAWSVLADIFLLRAKTLQDLANLHGWTTDELDAFAADRTIPERFRSILSVSQIESALGQESLGAAESAEQPEGARLGGGSNP